MLKEYRFEEIELADDIEECLENAKLELSRKQMLLKEKKLPVVVLFEGWGASGIGTTLGKVIQNMDPRFYTVETMNKIRKYNSNYDSYAEPTADDTDEVLVAGSDKTSGITVYKSYLLHKVLNSNELLESGLIGCNNEDDGACVNVVDTTTSCYNEYMAQSAILKGAK